MSSAGTEPTDPAAPRYPAAKKASFNAPELKSAKARAADVASHEAEVPLAILGRASWEPTEFGSVAAVCSGRPEPLRRTTAQVRVPFAGNGEWRSGSAPALGAGGRGFKSPLPDGHKTHAGVAQW